MLYVWYSLCANLATDKTIIIFNDRWFCIVFLVKIKKNIAEVKDTQKSSTCFLTWILQDLVKRSDTFVRTQEMKKKEKKKN